MRARVSSPVISCAGRIEKNVDEIEHIVKDVVDTGASVIRGRPGCKTLLQPHSCGACMRGICRQAEDQKDTF